MKKERKKRISHWTKCLDRVSLMYSIMSETCCLSHSFWAFHRYKFKYIYCISLELLSALWNPQGEQFRSLGGNWFSRNKTVKLRLRSTVTQSPCTTAELKGAVWLRTKFTRLPLFYAQIRYTKFLYSLRIIWYLSLILKGLSLPKKKIKKMLKDFAALWVYLMFGSNVNYFVMGGDVWKVCNGAQQVKITFLSISLFAFINQKLSANFLSVPLGMLFLQSMQHLK